MSEIPQSEIYKELDISELGLSDFANDLLREKGINKLGQVAELHETDLMNLRNFTRMNIERVKAALENFGLSLKR